MGRDQALPGEEQAVVNVGKDNTSVRNRSDIKSLLSGSLCRLSRQLLALYCTADEDSGSKTTAAA